MKSNLASSHQPKSLSTPHDTNMGKAIQDAHKEIEGTITAEMLAEIAREIEEVISELEKSQAITHETLSSVVSI
jgi:hypothetical protein